MPSTRRKSGNTAPSHRNSAGQSTLSFNSKPAKVTKSTATDPSTKLKTAKLSEPAKAEIVEVVTTEVEPQATQSPVELAETESPKRTARPKRKSNGELKEEQAEARAQKVTDGQIKKYWKAEEETRIAPRVHQEALSVHEKVLRHFDLSSQYGPCIGIPRLRRWKRAHGLGLDPPIEVLAVLLREEQKDGQKPGSAYAKMAYIDELSGGRAVMVE